MDRIDAVIKRYRQERVNNGRFQRHDGSGRLKTTADREGRLSEIYALTDYYDTCHSYLYIVELGYSGVWLDKAGIMVTEDVSFLDTNPPYNCVLVIIEDVSGDAQCSVPILLSLLQATQALNKELWSGVPFLLKPDPFVSH
ncbi:hypothetical protein TNCV_2870191 [Trichonephila clavipes]|nr:hypothetical protein TNCV_2870191 [Trichonephila clavipes]